VDVSSIGSAADRSEMPSDFRCARSAWRTGIEPQARSVETWLRCEEDLDFTVAAWSSVANGCSDAIAMAANQRPLRAARQDDERDAAALQVC
jgi:hypothetical protein